jgi:hypothetical protein
MTGCKLLILFEKLNPAPFLRGFLKKKPGGQLAARDCRACRAVPAIELLLIFMMLSSRIPI